MVAKRIVFLVFVFVSAEVFCCTRILDEQTAVSMPPLGAPAAEPSPNIAPNNDLTITFYMHDILGGSNPSARMVTGIVDNPAFRGQLPFAKPNGAVLPLKIGVPTNDDNSAFMNNNNIPFLTGLSGITSGVFQTSTSNRLGFLLTNGGQITAGSTMEKLMFGTITVIDDQLTEGPDISTGLVGRAQGFYIASSVAGKSQVMAFSVMFKSGDYVDTLCFFGVHLLGVSESQLAIMGGTGKFVNAKGYAIIKTMSPTTNQQETDGVETVVGLTVYVNY